MVCVWVGLLCCAWVVGWRVLCVWWAVERLSGLMVRGGMRCGLACVWRVDGVVECGLVWW